MRWHNAAPCAAAEAWSDVPRTKRSNDSLHLVHSNSVWCCAGPRAWPGCTAIAALLQGDQLWVANAGDCRAVLCRGGVAVAVSRDHNADDEEERRRVVEAGAHVARRMGNWRVGQAGIQVTRQVKAGGMHRLS